jgi:HEAT repeat protein
MPTVAPEVIQWIRQMGDSDQVVAFFAYQSLQELVLHLSAPGKEAEQKALAAALGHAITALAHVKPGAGAQPASFGNNPFLNAAASQRPSFEHPPAVRANLARLLGYLPLPDAVPHLAKALDDLDAREMARCSLESNPAEAAVDALIAALNQAGTTFRVGVLNSLAKRRALRSAPAIRAAAQDPHAEVRTAAMNALAALPDPAHDEILEKAARSDDPEERRAASIARIRLAVSLTAAGNRQAAVRIYKSVLESEAAEPQKKAARLGLSAGV